MQKLIGKAKNKIESHSEIINNEEYSCFMSTQYLKEIRNELDKVLSKKNLSTLFQPIVNIDRQKIYAYEGLIRGPSDSILHSPVKLYEAASQFDRLAELDFLCRFKLINQYKQLGLPGKLFLNTNPESLLSKDYIDGETLKYVKQAGLSAGDIVIEITETYPIENLSLLKKATNHYREAGFSIAIDDLGAGHSGLKLWSEIRPDFVKIDRHFITSICSDRVKRQFVRSIYEIANSIGCQVIAEGVESADEYATLRKLGAEYVQGFYFSHPSSLPPHKINKFLFRSGNRLKQPLSNYTAGKLLLPIATVTSSSTLAETADLFGVNPSMISVAIVDNNEPQGIITRTKVMDVLAGRFGRALFAKKAISLFMNREILVVDFNMPVENLSQRLTSEVDTYIDEYLIVKDGKFKGKGTLLDLLKKITDLQIEMARYSNPLTQLPGNVPIQKKMIEFLESNEDFAVAYCDLDNFKPYNDYYGYGQGDEVLKLLSKIFKSQLSEDAGFVGHIGGDDFILFFNSLGTTKKWYKICQKILKKFNRKITEMYNDKDRQQGFIQAQDRFGEQKQYPMMSLSIGIISVNGGGSHSSEEIAELASKAKSAAKKIQGSSISYYHYNKDGKDIIFKTLSIK